MLQSLKLALFPPKCNVCKAFFRVPQNDPDFKTRRVPSHGGGDGSGLSETFKQMMAPHLCSSCISDFLVIESPLCPQCGVMFAGRSGGDHLCGDCIKRSNKFTQARSAGMYNGSLLALVHRFKYHGRSELARPLGELLLHTYAQHWEPGIIDWVVPVPLHPRKLRRRGFNQSYLLVAKWTRYLSSQNGGHRVEIKPDILRRVRWTAPQTGLARGERQNNIKDAFGLADGVHVGNRSVLLVDDVYTTGATVTECARVLLTGGADRVDVLTLARAN